MRHKLLLAALVAAFSIGASAKSLIKNQKPQVKVLQKLPGMVKTQGMAIHGNYLLAVTQFGKASIYDIRENKLINVMYVPWQETDSKAPHANAACFGREYAPGNKDLPLLYVSTWYWNTGRTCQIYDVRRQADGKFTMDLVQTIYPNNLDKDIFGSGCSDWVVDTDKGYIYALTYKLEGSSTLTDGNAQMITKFRLPKLKDGKHIHLKNDQILDHYQLEMFNYSQGKTYYKGHIYINSGNVHCPYWMWLRAIDLKQRAMVNKSSLATVIPGEPEGLDVLNGKLVLFTYSKSGELYELTY
ncbi:MAG: hypothetical protein ILA34_04465 [Bacteroidaceae bacterium]|nr:hypothetical protein [Bacteroidaceae bacterium]